jgi:hypothetical protein
MWSTAVPRWQAMVRLDALVALAALHLHEL